MHNVVRCHHYQPSWAISFLPYQEESTALHCACSNYNISADVILKLLETGGNELLMMTNDYGKSAFEFACARSDNIFLQDIISKLLGTIGMLRIGLGRNKSDAGFTDDTQQNKRRRIS